MTTLTDIFAGAGGSSTGAAAVPGVEVAIAANHWQLAVDVHNENHPRTVHACVDLHLEDPRNFPRTDMLWASPECFTAGHLVTTRRGQVPIELVEVGDVVLTHKNRWREVVRVQARESNDVVVVKGQGHPGITTTASHRFWAKASDRIWRNDIRQYRRSYGDPAWTQAQDLVATQALWATPVRIDSEATPGLPPVFAASDHGWWLLGRWLGDGSLSFGRNHEVTITCGFHESAELGALLAGTGVRWHRSDKRTAAVFTASCRDSRDWLVEHCGHGAAHKQAPAWALMLGELERRDILHGYMSADGYVAELHHRASTVSRALAVTIRLLAESLGHRVSMAYDNRTTYSIEGRTGVAKRQWIMMWPRTISEKRTPEAHSDVSHAWSRVRSVTPLPGAHTVYNIEVAEDHSYVLDGIVVANCTKWSVANSKAKELSVAMGGDPTLFDDVPVDLETSDEDEISRSRLLMFDVLRFVEHHRYRLVIVENVVDVAMQAKYTAAWQAWQRGLRKLGYAFRVVSANSMHAQLAGPPAPQSRDRLYVVAWPEGERAPDLDRALRPQAWCARCERVAESRQAWKPGRTVGRYRAQYVYVCATCGQTVEPGWRPAADAIDWALPAERIGDRDRPLSPKTMARIREGLRRYGLRAPLVMRNNSGGAEMSTPAHEPLRTLTTAGHQSLVDPRAFILDNNFSNRGVHTSEPLPTLTTATTKGLVIEAAGNTYDAADPRHPQHGQPGAYMRAWPTTDPLRTLHGTASKGLLIPVEGRDGKTASTTGAPLRTMTTRNETGLLVPYYSASETAKPTTHPIGTLTTVDRYALVTLRGENAPKPVSAALDTIAASGNHHGLLDVTEEDVLACRFRMLEPHEIALGMAFPGDYRWQGTKRDRVRLAGNAVCPPNARDLITVCIESLEAA